MSELTHDDQRGREPNPNVKKGKNNKEKSVDLLNAMGNRVVRGEIAVAEIRSASRSLSKRWRRWMILVSGWVI